MVSATYESPDVLHQVRHAGALVVPCDFCVQVQPHAFDLVVIRALRGQEMQYDSLARELQRRGEEVIGMRFEEVEFLVGGLPASAYKRPAWWSNTDSHIQSEFGWMAAGYLTEKPDLSNRVLGSGKES
jgi:hypothetical protein